jgi:predicted dehydrogenase
MARHQPGRHTRLQRRRAYAAFAADIANGTHTVPDFADAVRRHEVIAAIESSAATGKRVKAQPAAPSRASSIFRSSMAV